MKSDNKNEILKEKLKQALTSTARAISDDFKNKDKTDKNEKSKFFDNSMNKQKVLGRCNRKKLLPCQNQLRKLFTKSKFEEVVPFQQPFRGECKADFHAACR